MSYLVDTNVISEIRKGRRCNSGVSAWWSTVGDHEIFLSVLTIGEIRKGIEAVRRRDPDSAAALDRWLSTVTDDFADRIVPIDEKIADEWGRLNVPDPLPVIDGLIAATARVHGLVLVTRDTRHVSRTDTRYIDPFS